MYAAPTSLSTENTAADAAATAPTPRATATTITTTPVVLPATLVSAARRPCARARPTMNSTLGPGIATSTRDAARKARIAPVEGMAVTVGRAVADPLQRFPTVQFIRRRCTTVAGRPGRR